MKTLIIILIFTVITAVLFATPASAEFKRLTTDDLKKMIETGEEFKLIDVRSRQEYDNNHIQGSVSIPLDTIKDQDPSTYEGNVVLYCTAGVRSKTAYKLVASMGYKDVMDLKPGINGWIDSGGKVVTDLPEEVYSGYPKDFIVPKGVCEQGIAPALSFSSSDDDEEEKQ